MSKGLLRIGRLVVLLAVGVLCSVPAVAQREPVLSQIDLPHPYYYREMYLPQFTTGPNGVTWSPDLKELIFSMAGSLWRLELTSGVAQQLTAGPGYDYQPDWSPDGRYVVFTRYLNKALELHLLELANGKAWAITSGGNVNVEPRWSPDGTRIAFVSTAYNRRFHIFLANMRDSRVESIARLTGETRSSLPRYYYSQFDHEISPAWSPDGKELIFVSNRGHIYGTGGFWRMAVTPGAQAREVHYEETTWRARPQWSPDGKRLLYASYLGRQWHQLWLSTPGGGDPFPISYGDFDNTDARWSPDGTQIAFISNRNGNTEIWLQQTTGGRQRRLEIKEQRYLKPMARLRISVHDPSGHPTAARLFVTGVEGRAYVPDNAWAHADDSLFPGADHEVIYFHTSGDSVLTVPADKVTVIAMKGLEYQIETRELELTPDGSKELTIQLQRSTPWPAEDSWVSADLHVHMNYGGVYRNTPQRLMAQAEAEDVGIVHNLVVNKEQRIPDIAYFTTQPLASPDGSYYLIQGQEFHTSHWGHMGLLSLSNYFLLPDYAAYPNTAAASLYPPNAVIADLAHAQGGLVGYVHPFDSPPDLKTLTHALPVDVALGKIDYLEVLGFSDHHTTAAVWYRLLNLGFRITAGAGTDAMANFATLRGPVGLNRVYVKVPAGLLNLDFWSQGLRSGHTFATNAPLLAFTLAGQQIGGEINLEGPGEVFFTATLTSIVPVDHLQVVCNGKVQSEIPLAGKRTEANYSGKVSLSESGWCLLRAFGEQPVMPVLDGYPYGTTSPIYVDVAGRPPHSPKDADYFLAWIVRLEESARHRSDWNTNEERDFVLDMLAEAHAIFAARR